MTNNQPAGPGGIVTGDFTSPPKPKETNQGGWAVDDKPADPATGAMAVDNHYDTDPLRIKDGKGGPGSS
jgi:hypothetical protein